MFDTKGINIPSEKVIFNINSKLSIVLVLGGSYPPFLMDYLMRLSSLRSIDITNLLTTIDSEELGGV